jgi:hypothetical protein
MTHDRARAAIARMRTISSMLWSHWSRGFILVINSLHNLQADSRWEASGEALRPGYRRQVLAE